MEKFGVPRVRQQGEKTRGWEMWAAPRVRRVVPGLCIGNVRATHRTGLLKENRITAIVSLTDARWGQWGCSTLKAGVTDDRHKWVQCVDSSTQDLLVYMSDICDFIDRVASPVLSGSSCLPTEHKDESQNAWCDHPPVPSVLVHCDLGISRSSTVIIAYLMRKYRITPNHALHYVLTKQKVKPSPNFRRQLQIWEEVGYQVWEDEEKSVAKARYQAYLDDRAVLLKNKGLTGSEPLAPLTLDY